MLTPPPFYLTVAPGMNMARCSECGGLVLIGDQGRHDRWHEAWHEAVVRLADPNLALIDQLAGPDA